MFTFTLLALMTVMLLVTALVILGIGGTFFTVFAADIIVAVAIIWLIFNAVKKK